MDINFNKIVKEVADLFRIGTTNLNLSHTKIKYYKLTRTKTQTSIEKNLTLRELSLDYALDKIDEEYYNEHTELINKIPIADYGDMYDNIITEHTKDLNRTLFIFSIDTRDEKITEDIITYNIKAEFKKMARDKINKLETIVINNRNQLGAEIVNHNLEHHTSEIIASKYNNVNFDDYSNLIDYFESDFLNDNEMLLSAPKEGILFDIVKHYYEHNKLYIYYVFDIISSDNTKLIKINL